MQHTQALLPTNSVLRVSTKPAVEVRCGEEVAAAGEYVTEGVRGGAAVSY